MKTNNAYDFDQYGHLIDFNPFQRVVPFPQTKEQKQLYQKAAVRPKTHKVDPSSIALDYSRDSLLTNFGKATLDDRYVLENENYQQMYDDYMPPRPTTGMPLPFTKLTLNVKS